MATNVRHCYAVSALELSLLEERAREQGSLEGGSIQYMIAFNEKGVGILYYRKGIEVDVEAPDKRWVDLYKSMAGADVERENHLRVKSHESSGHHSVSCRNNPLGLECFNKVSDFEHGEKLDPATRAALAEIGRILANL